MKIGVRIKLDVTKIEKPRLFKGKKGGVYLDATTFIDLEEQDQYGQNGFISQDVTKDERDQGVKGPIIGNVKVFYRADDEQPRQQPRQEQAPDDDSDTIPF